MNLIKLYKQYKFVFTELVKRDFKQKYGLSPTEMREQANKQRKKERAL